MKKNCNKNQIGFRSEEGINYILSGPVMINHLVVESRLIHYIHQFLMCKYFH